MTVLTSLDAAALGEAWGRPRSRSVAGRGAAAGRAGAQGGRARGRVQRCGGGGRARGSSATRCGAGARESGWPGGDAHDQARVVTPEAAVARGRATSCWAGGDGRRSRETRGDQRLRRIGLGRRSDRRSRLVIGAVRRRHLIVVARAAMASRRSALNALISRSGSCSACLAWLSQVYCETWPEIFTSQPECFRESPQQREADL